MSNPKNLLLAELNALLRLTRAEATGAHARRWQARSPRIERELTDHAVDCDERGAAIADAIRELGSIPDVVGGVAGQVTALARASVEQGQSPSEALLGDLALEHQLLDRSRFARVIAEEAGEPGVIDLLDRLEEAHEASIDWLMTRLSELAVGAVPAIQPTPVQAAVGAGRRMAQLPAQGAAGVLNRSISIGNRMQDRTGELVEVNVARARQFVDAAGRIFTAGRDATLERTQEEAREGDLPSVAQEVGRARRTIGALNPDELPIDDYEQLNVETAVRRIEELDDAESVQAVLAYETANKARKGVLRAAETHLEELAGERVGAG